MKSRKKEQKRKEEQQKLNFLKHKKIPGVNSLGIFYTLSSCILIRLNAILPAMKKVAILILALICCSSVSAKEPVSKTFLVLFKSKELKEIKTTIKDIESQFSSVFATRHYAGNSELALFIEIPSCDFDECFLGEFLVDLENGQKVQLQQIAFRLFDLTENKMLHQQYTAMYEESLLSKKKAAKAAKSDSKTLGAPGH